MKKIYYLIIALAIVIFVVIIFINNGQVDEMDELDQQMRTWIQENIQDGDCLQFEVSFETSRDPTSVYNAKDSSGEVLPGMIEEIYHITIIKSEQKIKIEHLSTSYWYRKDDTNDKTETYTDRVYYLAVEDGKVNVYMPQDGVYVLRTFEDSDFAEALSFLLFPTDLTYWHEGTLINESTETTSYPRYRCQRDVDSTYLYAPFAILNGVEPGVNDGITNCYFGFNDQSDLPIGMSRFHFQILSVQNVYAYAYEAWTGNAYENVFKQNDYSYTQDILMDFYDGFAESVTFDLPDV